MVEGLEQCDDSNTRDGDGCSSTCNNEEEPPGPECGNGVREAEEACDDGNTEDGDGCESTCVETPSTHHAVRHAAAGEQRCHLRGDEGGQRARGSSRGWCSRTPGCSAGGQVLVDEQGIIQCAACDCSGAAVAAEATVISCPQGVISPGLINAHDHITYQGSPRRAAARSATSTGTTGTGAPTGTRGCSTTAPPMTPSAGASCGRCWRAPPRWRAAAASRGCCATWTRRT